MCVCVVRSLVLGLRFLFSERERESKTVYQISKTGWVLMETGRTRSIGGVLESVTYYTKEERRKNEKRNKKKKERNSEEEKKLNEFLKKRTNN